MSTPNNNENNTNGDKLTVSQLRAKFEHNGGGETPSAFEARMAKLRAAKHNLALRAQQLQQHRRTSHTVAKATDNNNATLPTPRTSVVWEKVGVKRPETSYPDVFDPTQTDERVKGMSSKELKQLIVELGGDWTDCVEVTDLRRRALDLVRAPPKAFDVQTDDVEIDSMSAKQLKDYITSHGGDYRDCFEMGDLRLRAYDIKCAHHGGVTADGVMFSGGTDGDDADDNAAFFFPSLAFALASGDEQAINRALLQFFFENNSPERLNEVDTLLEQYRGREEELFAELASQQMSEGGATINTTATTVNPSNNTPSAQNNDNNNNSNPHAPGVRVTFVFNPTGNNSTNNADNNTTTVSAAATTTPTITSPPIAQPSPPIAAAGSAVTPSTTNPTEEFTQRRRKSSFVVGGVKKGNQWEVNPQSIDFQETMKSAGVSDAEVEAVLNVAAATIAPAQENSATKDDLGNKEDQ